MCHIEGERTEAVRTCATHTASERWSEEVAAWDEPGRAYTLRFMSEAPDFPFPVEEMVGGWRVEPDGGGSRVTVWYEYTVRGRMARRRTGPGRRSEERRGDA